MPDDLWVIFNNKVYDVSEFAVDHPGGADLIQEWGGKEVTDIMTDSFSHEHSEAAYEVLAELCIGDVVNNEASGFGDNTNGVENGRTIIKIDERYFRPTEVETLLGDPAKARSKLGWVAETSFDTLVKEMVAADLDSAKRDALVAREGYKTYRHHE